MDRIIVWTVLFILPWINQAYASSPNRDTIIINKAEQWIKYTVNKPLSDDYIGGLTLKTNISQWD
jgi:hypothetical protein